MPTSENLMVGSPMDELGRTLLAFKGAMGQKINILKAFLTNSSGP
jgi:hypothetical protein